MAQLAKTTLPHRFPNGTRVYSHGKSQPTIAQKERPITDSMPSTLSPFLSRGLSCSSASLCYVSEHGVAGGSSLSTSEKVVQHSRTFLEQLPCEVARTLEAQEAAIEDPPNDETVDCQRRSCINVQPYQNAQINGELNQNHATPGSNTVRI